MSSAQGRAPEQQASTTKPEMAHSATRSAIARPCPTTQSEARLNRGQTRFSEDTSGSEDDLELTTGDLDDTDEGRPEVPSSLKMSGPAMELTKTCNPGAVLAVDPKKTSHSATLDFIGGSEFTNDECSLRHHWLWPP